MSLFFLDDTGIWESVDYLPDSLDEEIHQIHVDTRDFAYTLSKNAIDSEQKKKIDINTLKKYPERFFFTFKEIKDLIQLCYKDTGGKSDWRMLVFIHNNEILGGDWQFKYLRFYKIDDDTWVLQPKEDYKCVNKQKLTKPMRSLDAFDKYS